MEVQRSRAPCPLEASFVAASWPGALPSPSRLRPEPPRAPRSGPRQTPWEVPPLALPTPFAAARKRSRAGSSSNTDTGDGGSSEHQDEDEEEAEDDDDCVFKLDYGIREAEAEDSDGEADDAARAPRGQDGFKSITMDSNLSDDDFEVGKPIRGRTSFMRKTPFLLGASPVLLSALEQMAINSDAFEEFGRMRRNMTD